MGRNVLKITILLGIITGVLCVVIRAVKALSKNASIFPKYENNNSEVYNPHNY